MLVTDTGQRATFLFSEILVVPQSVASVAILTPFFCPLLRQVFVERTGTTKPGHTMRLKGEGMPVHGFSSEFGDLLVTFEIDMPKQLTQEQKEAISKVF